MKQPIAIVGMSGRFPEAQNLTEFWKLLAKGKSSVTKMPDDRWDLSSFFDPNPDTPNKSYQCHGSFLKNIYDFDPFLFNISPAEAIEMSPSQKLMLELTWEAIEESSLAFDRVAGKKVGVFIGNIWSDFEHFRKHLNANATSHSAVGQSANIIANRISYTFGFSGPSLVVDTGCSSSLVALQLACQSIWDGGADMSVVGGINHILDHDQYVLLSKFGGLSKRGRCSTFSDEADGFVRGEGAGVVILKALSDAETDGDEIIAVVRGTGMNNNGYNVNLPATSIKGQISMLEEAYRDSGILPSEIQYIESHGTGTKLGDPTETIALGKFFSKDRPDDRTLRIGSVKTNIGHLEGAAGMAGLLKVLLSIQNRKIPASLHFNRPNPKIPFDELKITVNDTLREWKISNGETRKAGINSFGWGGTNAHTVLEEYIRKHDHPETNHKKEGPFLLNLSAKNEQALKDYASRYREKLSTQINAPSETADLCLATAINKPQLDYRLSVSGSNAEEIIEKLKDYIEDESHIMPAKLNGDEKIVFVFPGQGSQWLGMGVELYHSEPAFRVAIDDCEEAFAPFADWSLKEQLFANEHMSRLDEIDVVQPLLLAVEIALAKLWMDKGILPDAVVGHSMGEVASACISGAISLDDAAKIIFSRSKLMKTVSSIGGAMAVTELTYEQADGMLAAYNGALSVAVCNSPKSTVIAGDECELLKLLQVLEDKDIFCRQIKVDVASHSPHMDGLKEPLKEKLKGLSLCENHVPFYSTVRKALVPGGELNEDYWVSNLRNVVEFSSTVEKLLEGSHSIFIEMSPHPVLTHAINECAEAKGRTVAAIPTLFREKPEKLSFLNNAGGLFERGHNINWRAFFKVSKAPNIGLPGYPMQRLPYKIEDRSEQRGVVKTNGKNPLLGHRMMLAGMNDTFIWENKLSLEHLSFIKDHKVNNASVLPGVSYVEILYAALEEAFGNASHQIESLYFKVPVYLQENEVVDAQLKITRTGQYSATFSYHTKVSGVEESEWTVSAYGELKICGSREEVANDYLYHLRHSAKDVFIKKDQFYKVTDAIGVQYGNLFQCIDWIRINKKQAIAHIVPDSLISGYDHKYFIHPAILDSCFQTIFTPIQDTLDEKNRYTTFLSQLKGFRWYHKPEKDDDILVKAEFKKSMAEESGIVKQQVAITIYDENGNLLADLELLEAIIIDNKVLSQNTRTDWLYTTKWEKVDIQPSEKESTLQTWVIFEDHLGVEKSIRRSFHNHGHNLIRVGLSDEYLKIDDDQYLVNFNEPNSLKLLFDNFINNNVFIDGVIHAASLNDHIHYENLCSNDLDLLQQSGSILLMNIHKALNQCYPLKKPNLIVLTNGLQPVSNKSPHVNISQAPVWGLAKVLSNEQPAYNCRRIDISYFPDEPEVALLFDLIFKYKGAEVEIAIREDKTYVSRLVNESLPVLSLENDKLDDQSTTVVTGFGGAAFPLVEWIIKKGVKHIALISRSGKMSEHVEGIIEQFKRDGIDIHLYCADVADYDQLQHVFGKIRHDMPPVKGIIHAAGLIQANKIADLSTEEFLKILAPKMAGTWNLHRLSLDLPLEHFILFSSESSLLGLSGQGSYVAANTFIDYFAHFRNKLDLPAVAINWGVIEDVGMVANEKKLQKYAEAEGFIPFPMHEGVEVFAKIFHKKPVQIGIGRIDIEKTAEYYNALSETMYLSKLLSTSISDNPDSDRIDLRDKSEEEAVRIIRDVIVRRVSGITKASEGIITDNTTFKGLGIDSLMAIQLRNQLERVLNLKLAVGNFWKYPSIAQFSNFAYKLITENIIEDMEHKSPWWVTHAKEAPKFHIYCFHDAGSSSALFDPWEGLLPDIELRAVELPGRGTRSGETPITDMTQLTNTLAAEINKYNDGTPFAFLGHSMGGAIAFEVMRKLRDQNNQLPVVLFTSSTPALFSYDRSRLSSEMSEEKLIQQFPHLSPENITDEKLRQTFIEIMRNDLMLLDSYRYNPSEPFDLPIISLRGKDDPGVSLEQVSQWHKETIQSHESIERPGGHRYIMEDVAFVSQLINDRFKKIIGYEIKY
ncbi:MAG: SDR family NAD(P)-dependent oxidoreductase [Cytophagales bacterium]|nr:SDR family NAD(P)-dependent oxidoreductase [Cytophagales bacterium]